MKKLLSILLLLLTLTTDSYCNTRERFKYHAYEQQMTCEHYTLYLLFESEKKVKVLTYKLSLVISQQREILRILKELDKRGIKV